MPVQLNHSIVWCRDKEQSARFLAEILGLPAPRTFMHFLVIDLANNVSLDYMESSEHVALRHFGGRGVYFDDPNGHLFEIITRPYAA